MKRAFVTIAVLCCLSAPSWAITDAQIRQAMIQKSIEAYPGNCPCPYHTDRAGRKCGKRSAYIRPKGYSPFCYPSDIPQDVVNVWRDENQEFETKEGDHP